MLREKLLILGRDSLNRESLNRFTIRESPPIQQCNGSTI
jgi:hypothetical protein